MTPASKHSTWLYDTASNKPNSLQCEHVTVLYRQRSTSKPGEWLGRLVLGYEDGQLRIFGASIF